MTYISEIKGRSGKDHIDSAMKRSGPLSSPRPVNENVVSQYLGVLPDILIDFWRHHGLGVLKGGLMNLCLPSDFDGLLSQIFHADGDFSHKDCHVIGYGPFGELIIWSERHWIVKVELNAGRISCPGLLDETNKQNSNASTIAYLLGGTSSLLNAHDEDDKPLYARTKKKLGALEPGECYGFFPALAMGGAPNLANLKRVPALPHFVFLAQLHTFVLVDYLTGGGKIVRKVG